MATLKRKTAAATTKSARNNFTKKYRNRKFPESKLPIFDYKIFSAFLKENNVNVKHLRTIWQYLLSTPFANLSNLDQIKKYLIPKHIFKKIEKHFMLFTTKVVQAKTSSDNTTKLLVELYDGLQVETVIIRQGASTVNKPDGESQTTICVSSQVGCKMGCNFCATGSMGEIASLHSSEILEQIIHARRWATIRNIVFMGMGEPFNNYNNVKSAIDALMDERHFCLSGKRITVSTVGVSAKSIERFAIDLPSVSLAISLHASNQTLRERLTPAAKGLKIDKLIGAADFYIAKTNKKVMMEYVMLKGVNDSLSLAHELGKLLQGKKIMLNLIPYNNTSSSIEVDYDPTEAEDIESFKEILIKVYNIYTNVRTEKGGDIASACGQLVVKKLQQQKKALDENNTYNNTPNNTPPKVNDIEELLSSSTSGKNKTRILKNGIMLVDGNGDGNDPRVNGSMMYREGLPLWPKDLEKVERIMREGNKLKKEIPQKQLQQLENMLIGSMIFSILFVILMWYLKSI
jgi:23S rRNA (adenine(2503)-C(2))-methyltransferase